LSGSLERQFRVGAAAAEVEEGDQGAGPWKPKERCEISLTLLLSALRRLLDSARRMVARMLSRRAGKVRASLMQGFRREREAHASHALRWAGASVGSSSR
jgi:hypothetical protein